MIQRIRAKQRNEDGFTLTELLIVIVILGVLTGIVVFAVGAFTDKGKLAACKSDKKAVEVATEAFRAQSVTDAYPASALAEPAGSTARIDLLVTGHYLREAPTNAGYVISLDNAGAVTSTLGGC